jgi:hypothetical protein
VLLVRLQPVQFAGKENLQSAENNNELEILGGESDKVGPVFARDSPKDRDVAAGKERGCGKGRGDTRCPLGNTTSRV